jgi:hypothetical protein
MRSCSFLKIKNMIKLLNIYSEDSYGFTILEIDYGNKNRSLFGIINDTFGCRIFIELFFISFRIQY